MSHEEKTFSEMKLYLDKFIEDRGWDEYRTPKNLVMALSVEVGELVELFQWLSPEDSENLKHDPKAILEIEEEIADVLSYLIQLSGKLGIDIYKCFWRKTKKNELKHKVKKVCC